MNDNGTLIISKLGQKNGSFMSESRSFFFLGDTSSITAAWHISRIASSFFELCSTANDQTYLRSALSTFTGQS